MAGWTLPGQCWRGGAHLNSSLSPKIFRTASVALVAALSQQRDSEFWCANRIRISETKIPFQIFLRIWTVYDCTSDRYPSQPFFERMELARAIDMANETRAHVALMTGDLISEWRSAGCLSKTTCALRAERSDRLSRKSEIYTNTEN